MRGCWRGQCAVPCVCPVAQQHLKATADHFVLTMHNKQLPVENHVQKLSATAGDESHASAETNTQNVDRQALTIQGVFVLDEGFLTLGVGCLIRLRQAAPGGLSHFCLVKGFGKTYHRHVLPFALAPVVLLQQAQCWHHYIAQHARLDIAQKLLG